MRGLPELDVAATANWAAVNSTSEKLTFDRAGGASPATWVIWFSLP